MIREPECFQTFILYIDMLIKNLINVKGAECYNILLLMEFII